MFMCCLMEYFIYIYRKNIMREYWEGDKVRVVTNRDNPFEVGDIGEVVLTNGLLKGVDIKIHDTFYYMKFSEIEHVNEFEQGQEIEVRDDNCQDWIIKIFRGTTKKGRFICENKYSDIVDGWNQARPIQKPLELTLEQIAEKFEVESVKIVK